MKNNLIKSFICFASIMSLVSCGTSTSSYKVFFDLNYDGASSNTTCTVNKGEKVTKPEEPTRDGYIFDDWYTTSDLSSTVDWNETITSDKTYYAGWTEAVSLTYYSYDNVSETYNLIKGSIANKPDDPTRDGYIFNGWYTDDTFTSYYDFGLPVDNDLSLYASWIQNNGNLVTVQYLYNYADSPNAGIYKKEYIEKGTKTASSSLSRDGYLFDGWYTDEAATTKFDFTGSTGIIFNDLTLYAKWIKGTRFEAEYIDLDGIASTGFSNQSIETDLVMKDYTGTASNGYYIGDLYAKGVTLNFVINASADATASLYFRLSAEYFNPTISGYENGLTLYDTGWQVKVNEVNVEYGSITFKNIATSTSNTVKRNFSDFRLGNISLKQGENIITIYCNQSISGSTIGLGGSMTTEAPMIDAMDIYTNDCALTWNPVTTNTKGK